MNMTYNASDDRQDLRDDHVFHAFATLEEKEKPLFTDHPTLNTQILQKKNPQ